MSSRTTLARKHITAGALIRDAAGRVLLVEPTYRDDWLTPGGSVEPGESPADGAAREVLEELGVPLPIGRPLVMQWRREDDVLHFAYDGGVADPATVARFRLPRAELRSFRFIAPTDVPQLGSVETSARVAAAIEAAERGTFVALED